MPVKVTETDLARADGILLGHTVSIRQAVAQAIAGERERCAQIAEHLNGWGSRKTPKKQVAEHIASVIRRGPY
jgi:hypothetical protein